MADFVPLCKNTLRGETGGGRDKKDTGNYTPEERRNGTRKRQRKRMKNVTTPFQVWFDEQGKLVIDEEILSRINMKMGMFKGQEISMIEAYAKAELTERELWEIAKIDTNFNIQSMAMSDMGSAYIKGAFVPLINSTYTRLERLMILKGSQKLVELLDKLLVMRQFL